MPHNRWPRSRYKSIIQPLLLGLMGLLLIVQPSHAAVTLTDVTGHQVVLDKPAERVYIGFYYEDFLAINGPKAYDKVVAYSKADWTLRSSQWPLYERALPRLKQLIDVGSLYHNSFDFEKLLSARPDLVILAKWQLEGFGQHLNTLNRLRIPYIVVDLNQHHVPTQVTSIMLMGQALGNDARAKMLANEYAQAYQDIALRIKNARKAAPKTYLELGNKGAQEYSSSYQQNIWGPILTSAGAHNIATGVITSPAPLSPEYVLSSNPSAIFIAGGDWPDAPEALNMGFGVNATNVNQRLASYAARAGWSNIAAIKNKQLHALYHPGARTIHDYVYAQYIAKVLYPQAFADVNPQKNHARFYQRYLPIRPTGTFMHHYQAK